MTMAMRLLLSACPIILIIIGPLCSCDS